MAAKSVDPAGIKLHPTRPGSMADVDNCELTPLQQHVAFFAGLRAIGCGVPVSAVVINTLLGPQTVPIVPHVPVDVPSSIEVPNNTSGLQFSPLVQPLTIYVPSSIEVLNNNFVSQPVPHMASNVNIVLELPNNNSPGQQDGNIDGDLMQGALFAVADCATSITSIVFNPPSSSEPAYLVAVGIVFTAGMLAVLATLWVSCDARKRHTAKKKILYASVATFILGLAVNVYAYKVKK